MECNPVYMPTLTEHGYQDEPYDPMKIREYKEFKPSDPSKCVMTREVTHSGNTKTVDCAEFIFNNKSEAYGFIGKNGNYPSRRGYHVDFTSDKADTL